jgi:hypothetical protein
METDKSITAIPKVIPIIASETIGREIFLLEDFPFSMRFAIYSSVFK